MSIVWESNLLSHGVSKELSKRIPGIIKECESHNLDPYPLVIEEYDADEIVELAAYGGFPVRYPHFSFGQQYEQLHHQYHSGMGKIYEMVVNTDPTYMYLQRNNPIVDNLTVVAHALAHSDFFKNNICFKYTNRNMMNIMANHGQKIRKYTDAYGKTTVLDFLDACLSVDDLIDPSLMWRDSKLKQPPKYDFDDMPKAEKISRIKAKPYMDHVINPKKYIEAQRKEALDRIKEAENRFPVKPERDVMLFLIKYAPLKPWQQNILSMIRDEALYYQPQVTTKVMNEGWASYWDSYIMTHCGFAGDDGIFDYAKHHAGVLGGKYNLSNPYKLGNALFNYIKERWDKGKFGKEWENCDDLQEKREWDKKLNLGTEKIFEVRELYNDVTFINEFFTREFCDKYKFFEYELIPGTDEYAIVSRDHKAIKQKLISKYINGGRPIIYLEDLKYNKTDVLLSHEFDGKPLDKQYVRRTLKMIYKIIQRPVHIISKKHNILKGYNIPGLRGSPEEVRYTYDGSKFIDSSEEKIKSHQDLDVFAGYEKYLIK